MDAAVEMRIKIKDIPSIGAPLCARREVPRTLLIEVLSDLGGDSSRSSAEIDVELLRDHDQVIGRGRVKGVLDLPCSRCLEPARVPVDARLDLSFHREGDVPEAPTDEDAEALVDSPDAFTHDGTFISLEQPVRELLIAELPIAPVCKADCRGLCPTCGANRNTEEGRACGHDGASDDQVTNPGKRRGLAALSDVKLPS